MRPGKGFCLENVFWCACALSFTRAWSVACPRTILFKTRGSSGWGMGVEWWFLCLVSGVRKFVLKLLLTWALGPATGTPTVTGTATATASGTRTSTLTGTPTHTRARTVAVT